MVRKKSKKFNLKNLSKENLIVGAVIIAIIFGGVLAYQGILKSPDGHEHATSDKTFPENPQIAGEINPEDIVIKHDPVPAESISEMITIPSQLTSGQLSVLSFDLKTEENGQVTSITGLEKYDNAYLHASIYDGNTLIDTVHPSEFKEVNPNSNLYPIEFTFPESGEYRISIDYRTSEFIFNDEFTVNVQ